MSTQNAPESIRVLVVDAQPVTRIGVRAVLSAEADLACVGECGGADEALSLVAMAKPHVVVIDLLFPGNGGFELVKDLRIQNPATRSLMYSSLEGAEYAEHALRIGASGYLIKREPTERLVRAVRIVAAGKRFVSEEQAGELLQRATPDGRRDDRVPVERLTASEFEVFHLIGQGLTTPQIAERLHRSIKSF